MHVDPSLAADHFDARAWGPTFSAVGLKKPASGRGGRYGAIMQTHVRAAQ
jgi:hypothetical protein